MEPDIKRVPIREFRERGYLHEINRLLLHPLGMALEANQAMEASRVVALPERLCELLLDILVEARGTTRWASDVDFDAIADALSRGVRVAAGEETLGGVWDCRDEEEGVYYGDDLLCPEKATRVCEELLARREGRKSHTGGWVVQPVETDLPTLTTTRIDPAERRRG